LKDQGSQSPCRLHGEYQYHSNAELSVYTHSPSAAYTVIIHCEFSILPTCLESFVTTPTIDRSREISHVRSRRTKDGCNSSLQSVTDQKDSSSTVPRYSRAEGQTIKTQTHSCSTLAMKEPRRRRRRRSAFPARIPALNNLNSSRVQRGEHEREYKMAAWRDRRTVGELVYYIMPNTRVGKRWEVSYRGC